jgi:hypothetical protein
MSVLKNDIIFISTCDWHGVWYQRQHLACQFAYNGHRVFYFNRTLQRWPTLEHLITRLRPKRTPINHVETPENVTPITPYVGPPLNPLRPLNKLILRNLLSKYDFHDPLVITYLPSYIALDLVDLIDPVSVVYVNDHYYEAMPMPVISDLLKSEKELLKKADVIFGDSVFNRKRLSKLCPGKQVYPSLPGVYSNLFFQAFRRKEAQDPKNLFYFGLVKEDLNFELYNELSKHIKVVFLGPIRDDVRVKIGPQIETREPVFNKDLPKVLKEADIVGLFYVDTEYTQSVFPAKLFECIATCKPLLVSGLKEAIPYSNIVYDVGHSCEKAMEIISKLPQTETQAKIAERRQIASEADWVNRYAQFTMPIFESLTSKAKTMRD